MKESSPTPYVGPPPVPKMPAGLVDLVEGLTREVLKNNPKDLYGFCAKHLQKLLEVRDGQPVKNPVLTLEEKILQAQEKVREKAKERRERYDREINALQQNEHHDITNDKNINNFEEITKPPIHEDLKLALDSEVEIAHKSYDDEVNIVKNNVVVKLPEISIQEPDEISASLQQDDAIEKITEQTIDNEHKLSPENGEIANHSNNIIHHSVKEENNILQTLNDNLKEDKKIEGEEKPETKNTEEAVLEKVSVNVDEIHKNEEFKINEPNEANISDKQVANIPLLTENTETNTIVDSETTTTSIPVIVNDITEPQVINDSNDVNPITVKNTASNNEGGDAKIKDTEFLKEVDNEDIDNGESKHAAIKEVDQLSDSRPELKPGDVSENMSLITNVEEILSDPKELLQSEASTNEDLHSDVNETVPSENTTVNDDVSLETINITNNTVTSNISRDLEEEVKTEENVIDATNDPDQLNLENMKEIDLIGAVKVPEDKNTVVEATSEQKIEQVNDDNGSNEIPEISDVNDDKKIPIESDVFKMDDDIIKDNQNDQSNMDLETAAVTIQKVFRSFLFKSRNSTFDDITNDETTSLEEDSDKKEEYYTAANTNKERRALGINRMDTVLQTVNEEKSLSLSTDDSSTLSSAATTIQAHVRGFLVRNRLNSNKTVSTTSLANSNENLEFDTEQQKNKTVLNIHIVPEEANYLSRDESIITSMELSLDGSPPSSISLHPLSYDVSERRKLLKREDAVQSISPPSNNSGKLSEESVKEMFINDDTLIVNDDLKRRSEDITEPCNDSGVDSEVISTSSTVTATTVINVTDLTKSPTNSETEDRRSKSLQKMGSDESDVVTPYAASPRSSIGDYENTSKLVHSGEFHDVLLPTRVSRGDTTVVRGE